MGKRPFIIDCDTGTDDAIAIIAAFGCPEIEVKAITSVNGNVGEIYTSANNRDIAEYLGLDVEVTRGAKMAIYDRGMHADDTHGRTGLGDIVIPEAKEKKFADEIASEAIYRIAMEENGELELLVVGPMTNIAIALCQYPELKEKIKHIWFMGGAVRGGNSTTTSEFNIWIDPTAAKIVTKAGIPMTMVGLDVTERAILNKEDEKELRAHGTKGAVLAADLLDFMFRRTAKGGEDAMMHDSLALAAALCPECLTCKDYFIDVEDKGEYTAGHTMVDVRGRTGKAPNASVAVDIDLDLFRAWLKERIKQCGTV